MDKKSNPPTWRESKVSELTIAINSHKGVGESSIFYQIKEEVVSKVGKKQWEKILYDARKIVALSKT